VQIKKVPCVVKPRLDPEKYYENLKQTVMNIKNQNPDQSKLIDRSVSSNLFQYCDTLRHDGVKLRVTPQLLHCFFDLSMPQSMTILNVNERTMKRLRNWCGMDRWPRQSIMNKTHPTLTLAKVQKHRLLMLEQTYNSSPYIYGLIYEAHMLAGCDMSVLPLPASVQLRRPPRVKQQARVKDEYLQQEASVTPPPSPEPVPMPDPEPTPLPEPSDLALEDEWLTEDLLELPCFLDDDFSPFAALLANGEDVF